MPKKIKNKIVEIIHGNTHFSLKKIEWVVSVILNEVQKKVS